MQALTLILSDVPCEGLKLARLWTLRLCQVKLSILHVDYLTFETGDVILLIWTIFRSPQMLPDLVCISNIFSFYSIFLASLVCICNFEDSPWWSSRRGRAAERNMGWWWGGVMWPLPTFWSQEMVKANTLLCLFNQLVLINWDLTAKPKGIMLH